MSVFSGSHPTQTRVAPSHLPLAHAQTPRTRGGRTVAPAPVQAFSLTHRLHAHAENEQSRPRSCRLLTLTQAAFARGERTVASASVHACSLTHRLHARAGSEQSHPRPCKAFSLSHRLHAHAGSEQSHPRPCRPSLARTDCTRTRRANSRTRALAGSLTHAPAAHAGEEHSAEFNLCSR